MSAWLLTYTYNGTKHYYHSIHLIQNTNKTSSTSGLYSRKLLSLSIRSILEVGQLWHHTSLLKLDDFIDNQIQLLCLPVLELSNAAFVQHLRNEIEIWFW